MPHRILQAEFAQALTLRFQVYCLECNYLSPDDYPDGMESDEHDDDAAHFYAYDEYDDLVGYVRLVKADARDRFPLHDHCDLFCDQALPPPGTAVEISRLMVRSDFRRRKVDGLAGVTAQQNTAALAGERRQESPQVLLALYRQMYAYSREKGIRHWYAAMERPLARSLQRYNFGFRAVGPSTDYYGMVTPYVADLRELEQQVGERRPELMDWMLRPERQAGATDPADRWKFCRMGRGNVVPRGLLPGLVQHAVN